jgi:hypothetical protein
MLTNSLRLLAGLAMSICSTAKMCVEIPKDLVLRGEK